MYPHHNQDIKQSHYPKLPPSCPLALTAPAQGVHISAFCHYRSILPFLEFHINGISHRVYASVSCSVVSNSATPWTVACQALLSVDFSRQEYWSALPFPSPEELLNPGIEPGSPALQADSLPSEPPGKLFYKYLAP